MTSPQHPDSAWLWSVVAATVAAFAVAVIAAPAADASPAQGFGWLLFVGSSVHVAGTGWLFTFGDVRDHAMRHRGRYLLAPLILVAVAATLAVGLSPRHLSVLLLGYFGWQFFHYQKQNVGLAALAARSLRVDSLQLAERRAIMSTGWAGIAALLLHPALLQLSLSPRRGWYPALPLAVAAIGFTVAALRGVAAFRARPSEQRPVGLCAVYLLALCFPLPIFLFSSPYAAVGGMTIAHGLQYLVLVGLVARGPFEQRASMTRLAVLLATALIGGVGLNLASHLHSGGGTARLIYGAYLGVVMAHFVVDAGIWRLRDPFPRQFLASRIPAVLGGSSQPVADTSPAGVGSPR